jgi:hypothetical protein
MVTSPVRVVHDVVDCPVILRATANLTGIRHDDEHTIGHLGLLASGAAHEHGQ